MSNTPLDLAEYIRVPKIGARTGLALASSLVNATPKGSPTPLRNAARLVEQRARALREISVDQANERKVDPRPADQAMDDAVGALHKRLVAYMALPRDEYPRAAEAEAIVAKLFPKGLTILRLPFREEWVAVSKMLEQVDRGGLTASIHRICGKEFLENVRRAFERYGKALGITRATSDTPPVLVAGRVRDLSHANGNITLQLVAHVEALEPEQLAPLLRALDAHRNGRRRGRATKHVGGESPSGPRTPGSEGTGSSAP
jgi:hypothetical protein